MRHQISEISCLDLWPQLGKTTKSTCLEALRQKCHLKPPRAADMGQRREAAAYPLQGAWGKVCEVYSGALQSEVCD